ncbi:MAG: hypothetical protein ACI9E1_000665 [Cryomorphaceae bacterium]|jgi:hypothetical protein
MKIINPSAGFRKTSCLLITLLGSAAASNGAILSFDITLNFINAPSASEAAAFAAAEAAWESVITGYQIDDIFSTTVTINVNLEPIDGVGGTLGSAGPNTAKLNAAQSAITSTFLYADTGTMTFDTADLPGLGSTLGDVILHEMGHVLGIGTLWSSSGAGIGGRQELYATGSGMYTGEFGLAAYNAEFDQVGAFVPIELGGGAGTANGHWNENDGGGGTTGIVSNITGEDFSNELMTGWLGGDTFMSTLTIQSMRDLGYTVALVPEPSTTALLGLGGLALILRRRK